MSKAKVITFGERPKKKPGPVAAPAFATAPTDLGNAERFQRDHGDDVRHCVGWLVYDGKRWQRDGDDEIHRRAHTTARTIYTEAAKAEDRDIREALAKHAAKSEGDQAIRHMLGRAQHLEGIAARPEAFDADGFLLNVENGTVDLRTGELREHRRADLITKLAPVRFDPEADLGEWESFLRDRLGSPELVGFLQRLTGYSITTDTSHDVIALVHGDGGGGKSTYVQSVRATLGDYAATADMESFLRERHPTPGRARPDLVALVGSRMVVSVETDKGKRLAEGLIKSLSGGDSKTIRDIYRGNFDFVPTFKLWLVCNHAPRVDADDGGMWRRILRIPFDRPLAKGDQKPEVRKAWLSDPRKRSAILNWAIGGCLDWQRRGSLDVPDCVYQATEELRAEMDTWSEFFAEECAFAPDGRAPRKELRERLAAWATARGLKPASPKEIAKSLRLAGKRAGVEIREGTMRTNDGATVNAWVGAALANEAGNAAA